jgi:hypothetical protein
MPGTITVDKYVSVFLCMAAAYTRLERESEANSLGFHQNGRCELQGAGLSYYPHLLWPQEVQRSQPSCRIMAASPHLGH